MKNKKGFEMGIGTMIVLILAVLLLIVFVFLITGGLKPLIDKLLGFGGGESNVGDVVHNCEIYCSTSNDYNYCKRQKVVFDKINGKDNPDNGDYSCSQLVRGFNLGLNECGLISCESGCSDLEFEECQYEKKGKCVVEWVGKLSFEKHERMVSDGELKNVQDLTSKVSVQEIEKKGDSWICEKRVLN